MHCFSSTSGDPRTLPLHILYTDIQELFNQQPDLDKIPYTIKAGLQVESPIGELAIPIEHRGVFAIPENYRPAAMFKRLKEIFSNR